MLSDILRYHDRTKHHLDRYAQALGYLDWANQPNPFRRFEGAPLLPLKHPATEQSPAYDALYRAGDVPPAALDLDSISALFYDSLALSAWKQAPNGKRWSLRVNPSSGALHPTEGYLVAGPIEGLSETPGVYHYAPKEHALERRLELSPDSWQQLGDQLPAGSLLIGLTSIYWREVWKYGERAFRYCHHDAGHAIAAIALAAAAQGWQTQLVTTVSDSDLAHLLGIHTQQGEEAEHPDALLVLSPQSAKLEQFQLPTSVRDELTTGLWQGTPNQLSQKHHPWPIIGEISRATTFPGAPISAPEVAPTETANTSDRPLLSRQLVRQRRSAVEMDGQTALPCPAFYHLLTRLVPGLSPFPMSVLGWPPEVSLALFVHRVDGLSPGLYLLLRSPEHEASLRATLSDEFTWTRPPDCPAQLPLFLLREADFRQTAQIVSCQQEIAAAGAFSLGMLARFEESITAYGDWFYNRLFWETGLIGQILYLEAEAAGLQGTGIGCFFDDPMHQVLGIADHRWQSLYHFTVGGPLNDPRIKSIPPYQHLETA